MPDPINKIKLPGENTARDIHDSRIPGVDTTPTSGSSNVITSGGVYTGLSGKADSSSVPQILNINSGITAAIKTAVENAPNSILEYANDGESNYYYTPQYVGGGTIPTKYVCFEGYSQGVFKYIVVNWQNLTFQHNELDFVQTTSPAFSGTPTAPTASAGTNTQQIATTAFVQNAFGAVDAMIYKGTIAGGDAGVYGALTGAADKGWTYKVSAAGKIDGVTVEVGDILICNTDSTPAATTANYVEIKANWDFIQANIENVVVVDTESGALIPQNGDLVQFSGNSGHVIKSAGTNCWSYSNGIVSQRAGTSIQTGDHTSVSGGYHVVGKYNHVPLADDWIHAVGFGTSSQRNNALLIRDNGEAYFYGIGGYNGHIDDFSDARSLSTVVNSKASFGNDDQFSNNDVASLIRVNDQWYISSSGYQADELAYGSYERSYAADTLSANEVHAGNLYGRLHTEDPIVFNVRSTEYIISFPSRNGTIALTSDIPVVPTIQYATIAEIDALFDGGGGGGESSSSGGSEQMKIVFSDILTPSGTFTLEGGLEITYFAYGSYINALYDGEIIIENDGNPLVVYTATYSGNEKHGTLTCEVGDDTDLFVIVAMKDDETYTSEEMLKQMILADWPTDDGPVEYSPEWWGGPWGEDGADALNSGDITIETDAGDTFENVNVEFHQGGKKDPVYYLGTAELNGDTYSVSINLDNYTYLFSLQ